MMKKLYTFALALTLVMNGLAQQSLKLNIKHLLKTQDFALTQASANNLGNDFDVSRMQYYISKITVIHDGGQNTEATGVYVLVDAAAPDTIVLGAMNVTNVEGIKFHIGVNTPENNQDPALWPSTHALSPKNPSMHWGWASGYFFVAMSGNGGASFNNTIELHGLGNDNYFSQTITTGATQAGNSLVINIQADYAAALKNINVASGIVSHGETGPAAAIIANFRDFVFSSVTNTGTTTGIEENSISNNGVIVYPSPSLTGIFQFNTGNLPAGASNIQVTDITGRLIRDIRVDEIQSGELKLERKGVYFISLMDNDKTLFTQKVVAL